MGRRVQSSERGERREDIPCLRTATHWQAVRHFNLRNQELEDHDQDQDQDQDFGTSIEHPETSIEHPVSRKKLLFDKVLGRVSQ